MQLIEKQCFQQATMLWKGGCKGKRGEKDKKWPQICSNYIAGGHNLE